MTQKTLARFPDTPEFRSIGTAGRLRYWHPYELKWVMRPIAHRYPKTYEKIGNVLLKKGFDVSNPATEIPPAQTYRMWLAIMAAMPPHVIPNDRGEPDQTPWAEIDWERFTESLRIGQL